MTRMDQVRAIVKDSTAAEIDGLLVDLFTASLLMQCHDKGNARTKAAIETAPLARVVQVAYQAVA